MVDDLDALGKTPTVLARDIEKALGKYIRDPVVTVIVTNFIGPASEQIRVIGEATKPQIRAAATQMLPNIADDERPRNLAVLSLAIGASATAASQRALQDWSSATSRTST
jgi:protein involved in polysaccharide export with SLBB domain